MGIELNFRWTELNYVVARLSTVIPKDLVFSRPPIKLLMVTHTTVPLTFYWFICNCNVILINFWMSQKLKLTLTIIMTNTPSHRHFFILLFYSLCWGNVGKRIDYGTESGFFNVAMLIYGTQMVKTGFWGAKFGGVFWFASWSKHFAWIARRSKEIGCWIIIIMNHCQFFSLIWRVTKLFELLLIRKKKS